jgi:hypothetical protein
MRFRYVIAMTYPSPGSRVCGQTLEVMHLPKVAPGEIRTPDLLVRSNEVKLDHRSHLPRNVLPNNLVCISPVRY